MNRIAIIGAGSVGVLEKVIELQLNGGEINLFKQPVDYIRSDLEKLASP